MSTPADPNPLAQEKAQELEKKPDQTSPVRAVTDAIYDASIRATSWTEPPKPRAEPTESQKFRANLLLTFVGSVVFVFGMQVLGDLSKQSQIASERSNAKLKYFHDELKYFSETMPKVILKTYQMNLSLANYNRATAPAQAPTQTPTQSTDQTQTTTHAGDTLVPPAAEPPATGAPATHSTPAPSAPPVLVSPDTLYLDFRKLQDDLTSLPNGEALCHQLSLYLEQPIAINAVERLRVSYGSLFDADTADDVQKALAETNSAWDAAMSALSSEGQRLREGGSR